MPFTTNKEEIVGNPPILNTEHLGTVAVCGQCGEDVELNNHRDNFHACTCNNIVGMVYQSGHVNPRDVLDPKWNPGLIKEATQCDDWSFGVCRSEADFVLARLLIELAKDEDGRFLHAEGPDRKFGIAFDEKGYFGYVMWTNKTLPLLKQIYVLKERRRKGLGTKMLKFWAEQFAFPCAAEFGLEDPNEQANGLLVKLGYAKRVGDGLVYTRCGIAPWGLV